VDLELMRRVEEFWTSDNTDALDRLKIQEGYSYFYTPHAMMAWVTDVPNMNGRSTPLRYRFNVAMQGALGIGADLKKWKPEEREYARRMIELYKATLRGVVQDGALYRLASPSAGSLAANLYVAPDGATAALFATLDHQEFLRAARVGGGGALQDSRDRRTDRQRHGRCAERSVSDASWDSAGSAR
jgi:alpha-galactosidase